MTEAVRDWIAAVGANTAYIASRSSCENGYVESFNARMREEMLTHMPWSPMHHATYIVHLSVICLQQAYAVKTRGSFSLVGLQTNRRKLIISLGIC